MSRGAYRRAAVVAAAAFLGALSPGAGPDAARGAGVIVQDGVWGGMRGQDMALAWVRTGRVRAVQGWVTMECFNTDTRETYERDLRFGRNGLSVPPSARGAVEVPVEARDAGRSGRVLVELLLGRRRPIAALTVQANGVFERCSGFSVVRLARGPYRPPGRPPAPRPPEAPAPADPEAAPPVASG